MATPYSQDLRDRVLAAYGRGMETEDIRRLKQLEAENQKLKRLLADSMLDNDALKAALSKKYCRHETSVKRLR